MPARKNSPFKKLRVLLALGGGAFGLGLMLIGLSIRWSGNEPSTPETKKESSRKLPAWNIALGNLVVLARDLGFSVKSAKGVVIDEARIAAKIEILLQKLRELYRLEGEANPALLGGVVLQLNVSASGEVVKVRELFSRMTDGEFRKSVIAEVSAWTFDQLSDDATIICPLLFVREGMDITTLVSWEKFLSYAPAKTILSKDDVKMESVATVLPVKQPPDRKMPHRPATRAIAEPARQTQRIGERSVYRMKYSTAIRTEPNFSAAAVARFTTGTRVILLGKSGDWYEVGYEGGPRGFLRKEFIAPMDPSKEEDNS